MTSLHKTDAWVLYAGAGAPSTSGSLIYEQFSYPGIADDEVFVEPLFGSWEANMSHALDRSPVDVCRQRGESKVVLGNAGVVRVTGKGAAVTNVEAGDECLLFCGGKLDQFGYVELVYAYDMPGTIGLLAKETKTSSRNLFPIARQSHLTLQQWAAFPTRYLTAWSNWQVAIGCLRLQLSEQEHPRPYVWGWGGGTTLAELDLARRWGCDTLMVVGTDAHRLEAETLGIATLDRRHFPNLGPSASGDERTLAYRRTHMDSERRFLREVQERTEGRGVSIFVDYLGGPMLDLTLRSLGRQGVLTTAGWKCGVPSSIKRASECIKRHTHVHTHYARLSDVAAAMQYAETNAWKPEISVVYPFADVPWLAQDFNAGRVSSYFPLFEVNPR